MSLHRDRGNVILCTLTLFQVYKDGYEPVEREFQVLGDRPTLINVTMFPTTVRGAGEWWRVRDLDPHNGGGRLLSSSSMRVRQANGDGGDGNDRERHSPSSSISPSSSASSLATSPFESLSSSSESSSASVALFLVASSLHGI